MDAWPRFYAGCTLVCFNFILVAILFDKNSSFVYTLVKEYFMELTYDWNLKDLYKTEEEALKAFEIYKAKEREFLSFRGKLNNKEDILRYYTASTEVDKLGERLSSYAYLRKNLNGKDAFASKMLGDMENFSTEIGPKLAFIGPELVQNDDQFLLSLAKMPEFKDYDRSIEKLVENKKHILEEKVQAALNMNPSFGMASNVFDSFDDIDLKFEPVMVKGKAKKLTHATYSAMIENSDQGVRKQAYDNTHEAYKNFNYTLADLYLADVKETIFFARLKNYNSVFEMRSTGDKSTLQVLGSLFDVVHKNLPLFYKFEKLSKKALGLKDYYYFDNYVKIGHSSQKFDYERSAETIQKALCVMGEDYLKNIKTALSSGWIDVYEKPAKRSGGFNLGVYGVHPYILLNHADNYNAMSTLIHELGHAMHSVYSDKNQPMSKADPSIMVAEVASTVNEVLLALYMTENAKNKQEKLYYLNSLLRSFYTTIYRQTMFAEFEHYVYTSNEAGKTLVADDLNKKYEELQALYFGSVAKKTPFSKYEWSRIPHFYSPYYVYKYATGFISACAIAQRLVSGDKEYVKKYIGFLSAGSSVDPLDLLRGLDVDLEDPSTLQGAFELYGQLLKQYEKLI